MSLKRWKWERLNGSKARVLVDELFEAGWCCYQENKTALFKMFWESISKN